MCLYLINGKLSFIVNTLSILNKKIKNSIMIFFFSDLDQDLTAEVAAVAGRGHPAGEGGQVPDQPAEVAAGAGVDPRADPSPDPSLIPSLAQGHQKRKHQDLGLNQSLNPNLNPQKKNSRQRK